MKRVSIVLPVYNEEAVIAQFNDQLQAVLRELDTYQFEVVYVVDKSSDATWEKLQAICQQHPHTKSLLLSKRFGHQMSLVAGMDACDSDAVIMMDSDLQHPPEVIPELLEQFEAGYDIVHTERVDSKGTGLLKKATSRLFYRFINALSQTNIKPGAADFRLISRKVLDVFKNGIREQNQFLRGLFHWVGFDSTYVTFESQDRAEGKSKYNLYRLVKFSITGIISFSRVPLRVSIWLGFLSSLAGFVYGIYILYTYFQSEYDVKGWTSLIILILFLGGIQLISVGILGEYIGSIFEQNKNRPLYIVDQVCSGADDQKPG